MYVMMEAKRQSNMTAVQAYTTGCKNSPGYGGKDSTFFRSWGRKKGETEENNGDQTKSHHKHSIQKEKKKLSRTRAGPAQSQHDELSICISIVCCADEICSQNINECQGNVFELECGPNQHKRVTTLSREHSSSWIYILHFRHLAVT